MVSKAKARSDSGWPAGRCAFHEILDFLQIAARPFLLEADVLPAGLAVDLLGDVDARELLLAGLVAHHVRVRRDVGEQRAAAGIGFDQVAHAAHDHVAGKHRGLGAVGEGDGQRAPVLDVDRIGFENGAFVGRRQAVTLPTSQVTLATPIVSPRALASTCLR